MRSGYDCLEAKATPAAEHRAIARRAGAGDVLSRIQPRRRIELAFQGAIPSSSKHPLKPALLAQIQAEIRSLQKSCLDGQISCIYSASQV